MNFNLIHPETWAHLNQKVHEHMGLPSSVSVRVYQGVSHAAYELAVGTALFLSHKQSLGVIQGETPAFQVVMSFLYRQALQVQLQSQSASAQSITEWLQALKTDNSFVLHTEDNPITGECFSFQEVDSILNEKKIFSIRVSHRRHLWTQSFADRGITPSSVQICEIAPDLAVAICGARFKSPVQISAHLPWSETRVLTELAAARNEAKHDHKSSEAQVREFEGHLPQGFLPLLTPRGESRPRLFDRSLIYHPEIQGEALEVELRKRLKLVPDSSEVVSLNQCRWGFLDWSWWETKPTEDVLRSLLVLDQSLLKHPKLKQVLLESVQACQI